jgi:hypothetical protein
MKRLTGITAFIGGVLLVLIPRYIFPACEYLGRPLMHCSDTARAEYWIGALLLLTSAATYFFKSDRSIVLTASAVFVLSVLAGMAPDKYGYCRSPMMACNYGMVPSIRFIAAIMAIMMIGVIISRVRSYRKKGKA